MKEIADTSIDKQRLSIIMAETPAKTADKINVEALEKMLHEMKTFAGRVAESDDPKFKSAAKQLQKNLGRVKIRS